MRLYLRPGVPNYYADMIDPRTKSRARVCVNTPDKRKANTAAQEMLRDWTAEAREENRYGSPITLMATLDDYAKSMRTPGGIARAKLLARKATGRLESGRERWSLNGQRYLHTITAADMQNLIEARTAEGNGPQTIAHEIHAIRAACKRAVGLGKRGPATPLAGSGASLWRCPVGPQKTRYLSMEEYRLVYDYLDPDKPITMTYKSGREAVVCERTGMRRDGRQDAQDLLVMLCMTGGRWQEIAQITWGQVDLNGAVVRLWATKTQKERLAPLPEPALGMLDRRIRDLPGLHDSRSPVFPGASGGFRGIASCKPILRAMDAVGLNTPEVVARHGRATVHSLRHTFASILLQHGAALVEVQEALGHTTLSMTRRYAHLEGRKVAEKLGGILSKAAL